MQILGKSKREGTLRNESTLRIYLSSIVRVAENIATGVQQLLKGRVSGKRTNIHSKVKRNVCTAVVHGLDGATDLMQAGFEVLLLPFPKNAVEVAVVKIEEGFWVCAH
jgi:hypothetical protein